jgi:hypothetical protein
LGVNGGVGFTATTGKSPYPFYAEARYHYTPTKNIGDYEAAASIPIGATFTRLEAEHAHLPAAFYEVFTTNLYKWMRVYDYLDAQEHAEMWIEDLSEEELEASTYRKVDMEIDGDRISRANCVRQPFSESEIGLHKAIMLATRINLFWGLGWKGDPHFVDERWGRETDLLIGCVDSRAARND